MDPISFRPQQASRTGAGRAGAGASTGIGGPRQTPADDRRRLAGACSEFEAIFIEQLFKTMRSTVPGSGPLHGGRAEEIYTGMLDQQIAMEMAGGQGSIGLASRMQSRLVSEEPASEEQASPKR